MSVATPSTPGHVVPSTGKILKNTFPEEHVGKSFGNFIILKSFPNERRKVLVKCVCGKEVLKDGYPVMAGTIKSCGCLPRKMPPRDPKGFTANKNTFYSWQDMRRRCYDPKRTHDFPHYGGRGITVCDRWNESFANFLDDMGPKPDGYSLERKNVDEPYCPENCLWIPKPLQMNNTRLTRHLVFQGQKFCAKEACRRAAVNYSSWKSRSKRTKDDQGSFDYLLTEGY